MTWEIAFVIVGCVWALVIVAIAVSSRRQEENAEIVSLRGRMAVAEKEISSGKTVMTDTKINLRELERQAEALKRIYEHKSTAQFLELEVHADTILKLCSALREAEEALIEAEYQLNRIRDADWQAEQMRLGAKSGGFQMRKAITKVHEEIDFE